MRYNRLPHQFYINLFEKRWSNLQIWKKSVELKPEKGISIWVIVDQTNDNVNQKNMSSII